jgi:thiol-disulfide isomerase/thioredoxin
MNLKSVLLSASAACLLAGAAAQAQSTNTDETLAAQMRQMTQQVQQKAADGKHAEADYKEELDTLDHLIASKKDAPTDDAVQLTYMKAVLYLEVIQDFDKGAAIMRQIATNYPNTKYSASADKILRKIAAMAEAKKSQDSLVVGTAFPDFAVTNLNGEPLSVGAFRGKVVLLDFWATWCPPCRAELPNVIATYAKYHSQGLEIIGVSLDSDRATLDQFLKDQNGMTWPQYFDGQGWANVLAKKYGVEGIPFTLLIGPDGKIIGKDLRGDDLTAAVGKAVAAK